MASISSALPARVGIFNQHDSAAATNGLNLMLAEERWRLYFYFIIRHTHRPFFPIKTDCINVDAFTHKQGFFFSSAAVFFLCLKIRLKNHQEYCRQIIMEMVKRNFFLGDAQKSFSLVCLF